MKARSILNLFSSVFYFFLDRITTYDAEGFANLFKMSDIFLRKRTNRISKPKWININPKKFRKFQQRPDDGKTIKKAFRFLT